MADLAQRFTMLVRACGLGGDRPADAVGELDRWLLETRSCGVAALATFAAGLVQDRAAVRAALTTSWSNAQAEGQVVSVNEVEIRGGVGAAIGQAA